MKKTLGILALLTTIAPAAGCAAPPIESGDDLSGAAPALATQALSNDPTPTGGTSDPSGSTTNIQCLSDRFFFAGACRSGSWLHDHLADGSKLLVGIAGSKTSSSDSVVLIESGTVGANAVLQIVTVSSTPVPVASSPMLLPPGRGGYEISAVEKYTSWRDSLGQLNIRRSVQKLVVNQLQVTSWWQETYTHDGYIEYCDASGCGEIWPDSRTASECESVGVALDFATPTICSFAGAVGGAAAGAAAGAGYELLFEDPSATALVIAKGVGTWVGKQVSQTVCAPVMGVVRSAAVTICNAMLSGPIQDNYNAADDTCSVAVEGLQVEIDGKTCTCDVSMTCDAHGDESCEQMDNCSGTAENCHDCH